MKDTEVEVLIGKAKEKGITVEKWVSSVKAEELDADPISWAGGITPSPGVVDYLEMFDEEARPYIVAVWDAFDKNQTQVLPTGEMHQAQFTPVFSDGRVMRLTWRAWGDLCAVWWNHRHPDGPRTEYMDYYM